MLLCEAFVVVVLVQFLQVQCFLNEIARSSNLLNRGKQHKKDNWSSGSIFHFHVPGCPARQLTLLQYWSEIFAAALIGGHWGKQIKWIALG
jgi:hypothetical protein